MASDPIPEPPRHQEADREREPEFSSWQREVRRIEGPAHNRRFNPRLNQAAEAIGTALGEAVNTAREASRQGAGVADESKPAAQDKVTKFRERTSETLDEVRDSSARAYEDAREKLAKIVENARHQARHLADQYPLHIIAVAAGVGFVAGMLLRIWRCARD